MKLFNVAVALAGMTALGCSGSEDTGPTDNACNYIVGNLYTSVTPQTRCGASNTSTCDWTIEFREDGSYYWAFEDMDRMRQYSCSGLSILDNGSPKGSYNPETGILTWNSVDYHIE